MALPDFYQPERIGELYAPNVQNATEAGSKADISPSRDDTEQVALLLIDMQIDFIHADGALSVPGALEDTRRIVEWIYANTGKITKIYASLDSHIPIQIFSPAWWINSDGEHPQPYTVITSAEVETGDWKPLYDAEWSKEYVVRLEEQAKKQLMIWPYHTLLGTPGHNLVPSLYEAIAYHTAARQVQPRMVSKGMIAKTENYSIFEPEVKLDDLADGGLNKSLLAELTDYDTVYVAGQAKSHCVLESVASVMRLYGDKRDVISKFRVMVDGMSSVAHSEIDFEAMATQTFNDFATQGLVLTSTDAE